MARRRFPESSTREGFHEVVNVDPRESESERCTAEQFAARFRFQVTPDRG